MFVPFESIASDARIWIFQSSRPFTADESRIVESRLRHFTDDWAAHGQPLKTSFKLEHNQFIILAADEDHQGASGCSIDSSVRELKELERMLGIDLFDRNLVAFKDGEQILLVHLQQLKEKFGDGTLKADSFTFNNLVGTKLDFEKNWIVPASRTWLKRYIPNQLANVE